MALELDGLALRLLRIHSIHLMEGCFHHSASSLGRRLLAFLWIDQTPWPALRLTRTTPIFRL
jgi:hypothetical protein